MLKALSASVISGLILVAGAAADEPTTGRCLGDVQRAEIVFARCIKLAVWENTDEDSLMLAEGSQSSVGIYEVSTIFDDPSDPPLTFYAIIDRGEIDYIAVMLGFYGLRALSIYANEKSADEHNSNGPNIVDQYSLQMAGERSLEIAVMADGRVAVDGQIVTDSFK